MAVSCLSSGPEGRRDWHVMSFIYIPLFFFPPIQKHLLASYLFVKYFARHWRKKQGWTSPVPCPRVLLWLCFSFLLQPHLNTILLALDRPKDIQLSKYTMSSHVQGFELFCLCLRMLCPSCSHSTLHLGYIWLTSTQSFWSQLLVILPPGSPPWSPK